MGRIVSISVILMMFSLGANVLGQIRGSRNTTNSTDVVYGQPTEYEIGQIRVEGPDHLDPNTLISLTGLRVGDRITIPGAEISEAIKKLWKHGLVDNITIYQEKTENGQVNLLIELHERPRIRKLEFMGLNRTQEKEISESLSQFRGKVLTDAIVKKTESTIKHFFHEKGYLNTAVAITQVRDSVMSNHVVLWVDVDKKSKVRIQTIIINGNTELTDNKVKKKLKKTGEKPRFTILGAIANEFFTLTPKKIGGGVSKEEWDVFVKKNVNLNIFKPSKYTESQLEDDQRALIAYYNTKGYRDARIISDSIYQTDARDLVLIINLEEGNKYYIRDISWNGNYVYPDVLLNTALGLSTGDIYNRELLDKKLTFNPQGADISGLYLDNGYLFFRIDPVEWVDGDSIDIEMRMFEGEQAIVNKVIINGNDRTNDHVILRELRTIPGQKFSRQNLIRDNQQLAQLGYFDPEQIDIKPIPNPSDGTVDMVYNLVERPSDQVELSGGWGGYYGFVGTLGLSFSNFSLRNIPHFDKWRPLPVGDGQRLSIRMQANGRSFQNYSLTFMEPWLGGKKPNSLSVSLNHSIQRDIDPLTNQTRGTLTLDAFSVGFGKRLNWPDNYFTFTETVSYTVYGFQNWTFNALGFPDGNAKSLTSNTPPLCNWFRIRSIRYMLSLISSKNSMRSSNSGSDGVPRALPISVRFPPIICPVPLPPRLSAELKNV